MTGRYIAIGHWEESKNITSVVDVDTSIKNFRQTLSGNAFIPYVIITEKRFKNFETMNDYDIFEEVKKMTSNYRVWDSVSDYIAQCFDIMLEKLERS